MVRAIGGTATLVGSLLVSPLAAVEITPDADLCAALERLEPGQELVLQPGDYRAGCVVRRGGLPQAPIVVRAADPERRPRLRTERGVGHLIQIRAGDIVIQGLDFGPLVDADGVRIIFGNRVTVEDCRFFQLGGIAIVANHTSVDGLTVRRNVIADSGATGMYFGCHDGVHCSMTRLLVERNYINGVTAPPGEIGYGMQVKLNSTSVIRDNVIVNTKGPGIMVYGSRDLVGLNVIERNFVSGSSGSSGIVIGGGPVLVRNNVSTANSDAGIGLENYQSRGLLRGIVVAHNTI
ncbi:MAG: right-handed parallel beta-helix repeat-containing protein, partial [Gemmatimonadales bacterium]